MVQLVSTASFLESLRRYGLLDATHVTTSVLTDLEKRFGDSRGLARELLQRGWLTPYQVNQIFLDRAAGLWLEPYVILERLGEGGMGQVFKARHTDMQRVVALKLIRKEMLVDAEAAGRFRREVQLISQLTHPNVVQAHDAGLTGPTPFLAMEYVDGTGLGRLAKERGPLPVALACDYVRQAALGLQHIHERGLVHRDIKPANLIVSNGVVKIMDLGLARLLNPVQRCGGEFLTASGAVMMGTLDFMAPEQALDFSSADIRADIYSLGCTLYFLLTGQPPFPEGTTAQKLLMHQMKEPAPLASLRRDQPPALPPLIARMMAKQPANRFQTPGEVAQALAPFAAAPAALPVPVGPGPFLPATVRNPGLPPRGQAIVVQASPAPRGRVAHSRLLPWTDRLRRWPRAVKLGGLVVLGGLVLCVLVLISRIATPGGPEAVFLSDLAEFDVMVRPDTEFGKNGKGVVKDVFGKDVSYRVMVNGVIYPRGLFTHPPNNGVAHVSYRLHKQYRTFRTGVGQNDSNAASPTPYTFSAIGDGKVLWKSKPIVRKGDEDKCTVSVSGVELLELTVSCPGQAQFEILAAHAVWLDPQLAK